MPSFESLIQLSTAVAIAVGFIAQVWLAIRAAKKSDTAAIAAVSAAVKVEAVKITLETTGKANSEKLDDISQKVEEVHKATNSLTDRLVETTEKEAFLRGSAEEKRRRDDAEKKNKA